MKIRGTSLLVAALGLWSLSGAALQVVNGQGQPIVGAEVLVGPRVGEPFSGNLLKTDAQGRVATPKAWTTPLPVSVRAQGYLTVTYTGVTSTTTTLRMSPADGATRFELQGALSEWGNLRTDGKVDVGAVIPAFRKEDILSFDVGSLISPEFDTISVVGREIALPSNIVLPRQSESYIFPITFNKPEFRMYVRSPGKYRFMAMHAQFPLKRVVDDFRAGRSVFDIVNQMRLMESGLVDLEISNNQRGLTIPVNQIQFDRSVAVRAPAVAADEVVLSLALSEIDGYLTPSDVKRLQSQETLNLQYPSGAMKPEALSVLLRRSGDQQLMARPPLEPEDMLEAPLELVYDLFQSKGSNSAIDADLTRLSLALHRQPGEAATFLPLVETPSRQGQSLKLNPPALTPGITPMGMYLVYSQIDVTERGRLKTEQRTRLWEIWSPTWASQIDLPDVALSQVKGASTLRRWEVMFLGRDPQIQATPGVTHVSRSSFDE